MFVLLALLSAAPSVPLQDAWPPFPPVFPGVLLGITDVDHVIPADLDGDGDLDLVTIGDPPKTLRVHLGTGEGSFVTDAWPPVEIPVGAPPPSLVLRGAVAADFDGDGDPDVAVIGDVGLEGRLFAFLNDGVGGLTSHSSQTFQKQGERLAAIDVGGDGWVDLVMLRKSGPRLQLLRSLGPMGFASPQWIDAPAGWGGARDFDVGDVNGDGLPDLLTLNWADAPQGPGAFLYANDGLGGFATPTPLFPVGEYARRALLADLRGDGVLHAAVIEQAFSQEPTFTWFENDGTAGFEFRERIEDVNFPPDITPRLAVRDLDGDGRDEWVVVLPSANLGRLVLRGSTLAPSADEIVIAGGTWLAAGDFDSDGAEDLLASTGLAFDSDSPALLAGDGAGALRGMIVSDHVPSGLFPRLEYVDGDARMDLIVLDGPGNLLHVCRGLGQGRFQFLQSVGTLDRPTDVAVGDFNGDSRIDLAVTEGFQPFVELLLQDATGAFASAGRTESNSLPYDYGVAPLHVLDSDADGRDEVALYDWPVSRLLVVGLDAASSVQTLASLEIANVHGINGVTRAAPGLPEALELIAPGTASYLSLWVLADPLANPPPVPYERLPLPLLDPAPDAQLLATPQVRDLDGDGLRDVWAILRASAPSQVTTASRWFGQPGGTFAVPESDRTPFYISQRWAEDLDGDGALDYGYNRGGWLSGFPFTNRLQVHRPALDAQLSRAETYPWRIHDSGDVDGDGRLDLVTVVHGRLVSLLNLTGR